MSDNTRSAITFKTSSEAAFQVYAFFGTEEVHRLYEYDWKKHILHDQHRTVDNFPYSLVKGEDQQAAIPIGDLEVPTCFPVSGSAEDASPMSLIQNVVWLDPQGVPTNDVTIDYFLCQDIEAHVNRYEEPAYQKVLP